MKKNRWLSLTIGVFIVSMLIGCGNGRNENQIQPETEEVSENGSGAIEADDTEAAIETEADNDAAREKTLVVYFSGTGNTERVAKAIADTTGGELFELEPADPYTDEDLEYNDDQSRVSREYADESLRNVELVTETVDDWQAVERVYIGYPIWWGNASWPVNAFIEANDFTGKTVIPFCTSASSGMGDSGERLAELAGTGDWQEGTRFASGVSDEDVAAWVKSLEQ